MSAAAFPLRPAFRPLEVQRVRHRTRPGILLVDRMGISEPTFVPQELLPVVGRIDGERSLDAIAAEASLQVGETVPVELVRDLVQQLDRRLLLHGERFERALGALARAFLAAGERPSRNGGTAGCPAEPDALRARLRELVAGDPGDAPPPRGLIAPHIDLARGERGYAAAYARLLAAAPADLYVVLGTGHGGPRAPLTGLPLDWRTPLGAAPTDRAFVAAVHDVIGAAAEDDLFQHRDEHSLEFQVLFLQHLAELRGGAPFAVAGFLCGALPSVDGDPVREEYVQRIVRAFTAAERASGKRVCYVAGADLAHLGPWFGDAEPVGASLLQRLERDEHARLAELARGAPGAFHRAVAANGNPDRVCSATAITLTALLAGGPAELLHYGQAAADDGAQVVSFCAAVFAGAR